ncbi:DNA-directed RNA polymerase subunit omega [Acidobacteriota bacterium]
METPGFIDSKFRLAILAAKRAKQLVSGARKKIEINAENPLTVALEEIRLGKINFQIFEENEFEKLHADSSNDEEDILEALGDVDLEDDYEENDAIEEVEEDNEKEKDEEDEKEEAEDNNDEKEDDNEEKQEEDD